MAADERGGLTDRKRPVIFAGVIGGAAGAALAGHRGARAAGVGAAAGAVALTACEAVARARQRPGGAANDTGEDDRPLPVRQPAALIRCHDPKPIGPGLTAAHRRSA